MARTLQISLPSAASPDDGVASLDFALYVRNDNVTFGAHMNPDEEVIDANEGDFPQFDCVLSIEDFKKLRAMFNEIVV